MSKAMKRRPGTEYLGDCEHMTGTPSGCQPGYVLVTTKTECSFRLQIMTKQALNALMVMEAIAALHRSRA